MSVPGLYELRRASAPGTLLDPGQPHVDEHTAQKPEGGTAKGVRKNPHKVRGALWRTGELLAGLAVAAMFLPVTKLIAYDPTDRTAQISAEATLHMVAVAAGAAIVVGLVVSFRIKDALAGKRLRAVCWSGVSGVASGFVAAGSWFALRGTDYMYGGAFGDARAYLDWTESVMAEGPFAVSANYPPLVMWSAALVAKVLDIPASLALKLLMLALTMAALPLVYLGSRMILPPGWALVPVFASLPLFNPVKPFEALTMALFVVMSIRLLASLSQPSRGRLSDRRRMGAAAGLGAGIGIVCITYSGWFFWCVLACLGLAVHAFFVSPDRLKTLLDALVAAAAFLTSAGVYVFRLVFVVGTMNDDYFYSDTRNDPAYFLLYRGTPGADEYDFTPPAGDFVNVGVFTLLLVAALGGLAAISWDRMSTKFIVFAALSAWVMRMYFASQMYETGLVQLYPRTSRILNFLFVFALGLLVMHVADRFAGPLTSGRRRAATASAAAAVLVLSMAASAITDTHMLSRDDKTAAAATGSWLAWLAHCSGDLSPFVTSDECVHTVWSDP